MSKKIHSQSVIDTYLARNIAYFKRNIAEPSFIGSDAHVDTLIKQLNADVLEYVRQTRERIEHES